MAKVSFNVPNNIAIGFTVSYLGLSFLLFEFPNNVIQDINLNLVQLGLTANTALLPLPLESPYALLYAFFPAFFSLIVTIFYAKGVYRREA